MPERASTSWSDSPFWRRIERSRSPTIASLPLTSHPSRCALVEPPNASIYHSPSDSVPQRVTVRGLESRKVRESRPRPGRMCTPRGKHGGAGDGGGLGPEHVRGQAQPIPVQGGRLVALEPALGTDDEDPLPAGGNWQRSHVVAVG